MQLFWDRGYEATSVSELTEVMGITPPSLYAAFGDKKHLFLETVDRYQAGPGGFAQAALGEPTADRAMRRLLMDTVELFCNPKHPKGCMVVLAATNCTVESDDVLAGMITTTLYGLSIKARDGASRAILRRIVEQTLLAWPHRKSRRHQGQGRSKWQRDGRRRNIPA